jgi:hypothetical protein
MFIPLLKIACPKCGELGEWKLNNAGRDFRSTLLWRIENPSDLYQATRLTKPVRAIPSDAREARLRCEEEEPEAVYEAALLRWLAVLTYLFVSYFKAALVLGIPDFL